MQFALNKYRFCFEVTDSEDNVEFRWVWETDLARAWAQCALVYGTEKTRMIEFVGEFESEE